MPHPDSNGEDPYLEFRRRLRRAREDCGLSLRQLSEQTRVSITVLEALEKGWCDRLPEAAYMPTIMAVLEQHLGLEQGHLEAALPLLHKRRLRGSLQGRSERPSLTSIALFATWQGAFVYALLCLALIYGINLQQQRLVVQGLMPQPTAVPARPLAASEASPPGERDRTRVLAAYPDLRPLDHASRGQGLALLRRQDDSRAVKPASPGRPTESSRPGAQAATPDDAPEGQTQPSPPPRP